MKKCISCKEINNDSDQKCQKCGCSIFEESTYSSFSNSNTELSIDKVVENINISDVLQTLSVIIFCIGLFTGIYLLYSFSQPGMFSRGGLNFIEVLIVLVVVFYHIVLGSICFGLKEILKKLNGSLQLKDEDKKFVSQNTEINETELLEKQARLHINFLQKKVPILLTKNDDLSIKLKSLFDKEQKNIINAIEQILEKERDKIILRKYSELTYSGFLAKAKSYEKFDNSELFVFRELLDEFFLVIEEKGVELNLNIQNSLTDEDNDKICKQCGSELVIRKTKNDKKVLVCSKYPECKELTYI